MAGRREPKKGLPRKPLKNETVSRVKRIVALMSTGGWQGRITKEALASEWGMTYESVEHLAQEASRHMRLALEKERPYIAARFLATLEFMLGDCVQRVQNEVYEDKGGRVLSAVGRKGRMRHEAAQGYYQTAQSAITSAMHILREIPELPVEDGGVAPGAPGRSNGPGVVINIIAKRPPDPPAAAAPETVPAQPPSPTPPAPVGAAATPPGDKPPTG